MVRANANWAAVGLVSLMVFLIKSINKRKKTYLAANFFTNFVFGFWFFLSISLNSSSVFFDRIRGVELFSDKIKNNLGTINNIVISDRLLYSNLAYEFKNEEFVLYMPLSEKSKITKHFQIKHALNKNTKDDFLLIGDLSEIDYLKNKYSAKLISEQKTKFKSSAIRVYEIVF